LHEVIRLSGMNLIIDDTDHPLIIKVASIPQIRLQVYFIDNQEFFSSQGVFPRRGQQHVPRQRHAHDFLYEGSARDR